MTTESNDHLAVRIMDAHAQKARAEASLKVEEELGLAAMAAGTRRVIARCDAVIANGGVGASAAQLAAIAGDQTSESPGMAADASIENLWADAFAKGRP